MNRVIPFGVAVALFTLGTSCARDAQPTRATVSFDPDYGRTAAKTLTAGEVEIVYVEKGQGAPVVFYYPGFDYRYWQWQVEGAAEEHHATAFSFVPQPTGLPFDLLSTAELAAALEALELGPVHLVAHSIGAWQAMVLAAERPELFRTLVLEEPAVGLRDTPAPECSLTDASEAERATCLFSNLVAGSGWFEALPAELRRYFAEFSVGTPQVDERGETVDPVETEFPSICEDIAQLAMPILFVRGEDTPAYLQPRLDRHEDCLPEHETVSIVGASHSVHVDRPAEYNRAVLEFVGRHEMRTVRSEDGTQIGYAKIGTGAAPLVIVHGVLDTAESWVPVATALAEHCTCYVIDRRGRGRSGDGADYGFDREIQDIGAVLAEAGSGAYLLGHSSGAIYALEAAHRYPVAGLMLYEPPLHYQGFEEVVRDIRALTEQGRLDEGAALFFTAEAGLSQSEMAVLRAAPFWPQIAALAPTLVRESCMERVWMERGGRRSTGSSETPYST